MKTKVLIVVLVLFSVPLFAEDPPPPIFDNISVTCSAVYGPNEEGWWQYTYQYYMSNPSSNTADIFRYYIPIYSSDDVIFPPPNPDTPTARVYYENYCMMSLQNSFGPPTTSQLIPPNPFVSVMAITSPGQTDTTPCNLRSYHPPSLNQLWLHPDIYDYLKQLAIARIVQEGQYFPTYDIKLSYLRKIPSLGPSPAFPGSFSHWDTFISDVGKAKDLGWLMDMALFNAIDQKLRTARQAAYDNDLTTVNAKLDEVIQLIESSTAAQRKDEVLYLVDLNAKSLKDNIPWPLEPKLTATPYNAKHPLGEFHQVEAKLINNSNGLPIADTKVVMEVYSWDEYILTQEVNTDSQGIALFSYTNDWWERIDTICLHADLGEYAAKPKGKMPAKLNSKKQNSGGRTESTDICSYYSHKAGPLYVEWEGYIDLAAMLAPKAMQVSPGQTIYLSATVNNFGTVPSPQTSVRFYMADAPFNQDPPPEMVALADLSIEPIETGKFYSCSSQAVVIPESATQGIYYFDACADPDNEILEPTEWNNCASATASLTLVLPQEIPTNIPPDCLNATATPNKLWPPNHKLKDIQVQGVTDADGDAVTLTVTSITQDEPVNGQGDGDASPDGFGVGTANPQVRAERSGTGNGRGYRINFKAVDAKSGECSGFVTVGVPHDKKDTPIDDGQNYDSTLP